ncbi:MAG TPA: DUF4097 family beta strand repeat-containing protein [Actinospica sp.]|jgi:DUF4097 and DUF4098 domain-containing protein YvlB|nr:DUF4097 family beta strand repeat-containing protein [Actinospica sp.]
MTTRTLTHPEPGPVTFDAWTFATDIEVTITDTKHATVTVSTPDTDGPAHDAVTAARLEHGLSLLTAHVQDRAAAGGITITRRGGSVSVRAVTVAHNVSIIGSRVFMNGAEVTDTLASQAPVTVRAELPRGSKFQAQTEAGAVTTRGPLALAWARTISGDVRIESAETANVTTTSGDVTIDQAHTATPATTSGDIEIRDARRVMVRTVSGDTRIKRGEVIQTQSVSGDVTIHEATGHTDTHTVSGDITIRHTGPTPRTHTVTGRVHVTALQPSR